jgi:hypothetical protein
MGWETRARGGRYYTRSRKLGGRVVREYVGTGPIAALIADQDAAEREQRAVEQQRLRRVRAHLAPLETMTAELDQLAELLARAALVAHGYRQHHRSEWRKRRDT